MRHVATAGSIDCESWLNAVKHAVNRLIAIGFWNRDIVFKTIGDRLIKHMCRTECFVTGLDIIGNDSKSKNIGNIAKLSFAMELFINTVKVFFTADYRGLDTPTLQLILE